jgi:phosphate acetyltransferase
MSLIQTLRARAASLPKRIVLPEAADDRTRRAADFLASNGICEPILVGPGGVDPSQSPDLERYVQRLYLRRQAKGLTLDAARALATDPLYFASLMVGEGDADGCVTGAATTTADVLRAALYCIGLAPGTSTLSSAFLMEFPDGRVFTYGDCAVVPYPDAKQLAEIALSSAKTHHQLTGETPRVALLSFSTKGSAAHERVDLVREALTIAKERDPQLMIDGELQFDAALLPAIGQRKAPGSDVAGQANVFIFPNLDAGNIGYKMTERLAGATATGPIIQGLAKPMHDLSRGASWEDIVNTVAVSAVQAAG